MKLVLQILHRIRRLVLRLTGWKTRGVKVMLFNRRGEVLLVRNSYGDRAIYVFPGGGIGSSEAPAAAAVREVEEEAGITPEELKPFGTYLSTVGGTNDTIHLFTGITDKEPEPDGREVEEARFFPLDALPPTTSDATLRRLAEYRGEQARGGSW